VPDVLEGLDRSARERIEALRREGRFFWIDVSSGEAERDDLRDALGIPEGAFAALFAFGDRGPRARKLFAGDGVLVFPFTSYLESVGRSDGTQYRLHPIEVHVLVSRDHVLTLQRTAFRCLPGSPPICRRGAATGTPSTRSSRPWWPPCSTR
jgi:Mg2+ and Co2+ transporter CorA